MEEQTETTVKGWLTRDKKFNDLCLHYSEPYRTEYDKSGKGEDMWASYDGYIILDSKLFPEITWNSEPCEVEITIKIKE